MAKSQKFFLDTNLISVKVHKILTDCQLKRLRALSLRYALESHILILSNRYLLPTPTRILLKYS